ncbi:hypothetical protein B0T26DRAFT_646443, partial [Lasiosphaeria miniovina]
SQREYVCGHFVWLASKHCEAYKTIKTRRTKCEPNVTAFEERQVSMCGECRPAQHHPWTAEFMRQLSV